MGWWEDLFSPLDDKKRRQVLHPGSGMLQVDRDRLTPGWEQQNRRIAPKPAVSRQPINFNWEPGQLSESYLKDKINAQNQNYGQVPDDMYAAAKARMNPRLNPEPPAEKSLMEQILEKIDAPYQGGQAKIDTSILDSVLRSQLGQIGQVRNNTNQNFQESDRNLQGMHGAARNEVLTQGKQRFEDISNDQLAGLKASRQETVGELQRYKDEENAKRMAMLKNLGIEASGATPSDTSAYDQGIASITNRSAAEQANAVGDKATNLAYNTTVANSIGQQGAQRRSELAQQLQGILGKLGMAETEANQQYNMQKAQMQGQSDQNAYDAWQNERKFNQQRYNDLFGQKMQMDEQAARQQQAMMKAGAGPEVLGYSGLAEDLLNTGFGEDESQRAMQVLSEILSSDYMKGIPEGYDKASILARRLRENQVNPVMASQLATNYSNLGNVNGYKPY
jgi:hypothetical protein